MCGYDPLTHPTTSAGADTRVISKIMHERVVINEGNNTCGAGDDDDSFPGDSRINMRDSHSCHSAISDNTHHWYLD